MAASGRGTGIVGYNVQTAVDDKHHLIVAHEVTNVGHDRAALATMAEQAREATYYGARLPRDSVPAPRRPREIVHLMRASAQCASGARGINASLIGGFMAG